jgi:hypothetical protein
MSKLGKLLSTPGPNVESLKAIAKIALIAEARLRELGVKIVDDDFDTTANNGSVEFESIEGGEKAWLEL